MSLSSLSVWVRKLCTTFIWENQQRQSSSPTQTNSAPLVLGSSPQTLQQRHWPGKLVLAVDENLAMDAADDLGLVLRAAVLQHMLYDVVAVLVLHQTFCLFMELCQNAVGLLRRAVLQDTLDHATAVWVGGQVVHLWNSTHSSFHLLTSMKLGLEVDLHTSRENHTSTTPRKER